MGWQGKPETPIADPLLLSPDSRSIDPMGDWIRTVVEKIRRMGDGYGLCSTEHVEQVLLENPPPRDDVAPYSGG